MGRYVAMGLLLGMVFGGPGLAFAQCGNGNENAFGCQQGTGNPHAREAPLPLIGAGLPAYGIAFAGYRILKKRRAKAR